VFKKLDVAVLVLENLLRRYHSVIFLLSQFSVVILVILKNYKLTSLLLKTSVNIYHCFESNTLTHDISVSQRHVHCTISMHTIPYFETTS